MTQIFDGYTLEDLEQNRVPWHSISGVIDAIGKANERSAQPVVERYLNNSDEELRNAALLVLFSYWKLPEHEETARQMLFHDAYSLNRSLAADCLGSYYAKKHDAATLHLLAHVVANTEENTMVRQSAYSSMLEITGTITPMEQFNMMIGTINGTFDVDRDVDWEFVRTHLA